MARSFTPHFKYGVFLSFRGEDTRSNFTGHLYNAFCRRGIDTFFDDQNLRLGDEISPCLLKAIEQSRISVVVFSQNYASSTWCLDELVKIYDCMKKNNQRVWPIFYKVDPSDVRHQKNRYGEAMAAHENRFGEDPVKVRRVRMWRSALTEVANLTGVHFRIDRDKYEYESIDKIVEEASAILPFKGLYIEEHLVGLESRRDEVISLLDIPSDGTVCMLGVHGTGGMGKTTIAKVVYNWIVHQFEYAVFLSDVRETSNKKGLVSLQETLLSKILRQDIKLSGVDEGASLIKNRLCNMRVLLVLDDVDSRQQLEKLVGNCDWFGSGSRIILTTRDKHLLLTHQVEKTYEMKELNNHAATELFCWKAFNNSQPPEKFVALSDEVVNYANGLPLALKVIGSNLFGMDLDECECALDQYRRIPNKDIQDILKISYDGLEYNEKEIFLDIACFFKGNWLKDVQDILDACELGSKYHVKILINKSLIAVDEWGQIRMHDLIQDMGKEIVRMISPKKPEERSRLWFNENVIKVLQENLGTSNIEAIMLDSCQQEVQWDGTAFEKMKNLRILIIRNACFSVGPKYLPDNLRVLEWEQYPLSSLPPNFDPKKLVILKMPDSCLKLEKSFEKFKYITVMAFSFCEFISEVPDMSKCPVLRKLSVSFCKNLIKVHDSVGFHTKLTYLSLLGCKNLIHFPSVLQMTSLEALYLDSCKRLKRFPDILGNMDRLLVIDAGYTAIKELPNSIGNLTRLKSLRLSNTNLVSIPASVKRLSNLSDLDVHGCKKLKDIYEIPSNLKIIRAYSCTSLTSQSESLLWSQVIERTSVEHIVMSGPIPDWFDHCTEGRVISFWVRGKLPDVAFAYNEDNPVSGQGAIVEVFLNGVSLETTRFSVVAKQRCHLYSGHPLNLSKEERYLEHDWNHVEIRVATFYMESLHWGLYVYKQGTSTEDVRFECPNSTASVGLVPRNVLKRGTAFHPGKEPPKKLRKNHKPRDCIST